MNQQINKLKVVIINKSDIIGGAAIASLRQLHALRDDGIDASMLVVEQASGEKDASIKSFGTSKLMKYYFLKERLKIFLSNGFSRKELFKVSIANSGFDLRNHPDVVAADVIVLNWINQGALSLNGIEQLSTLGKPIVWTMHDMWVCTGICHHAYDCTGYKVECGKCVYLNSNDSNDLSHDIFKQKRSLYSNNNIHFVAVSNWLAERCHESGLLSRKNITVIHNAFPVEKFNTTRLTNDFHDIPKHKKIIVMGAARLDDPIKGFDYMIAATRYIATNQPQLAATLHIVLYGNIRDRALLDEIKIPYTYLGAIKSTQEIANVYAHADIVLSTSLFETLGYTIIEGQASGCIPVSFGSGGQIDIIDHLKTGYIAKYKSAQSIAEGINWAVSQNISRDFLHNEVAQKFSQKRIAGEYISLFNSLLNKK